MLNPFGHDYSLAVVAHWLANDPSLPMAVLLALMGYQLGNRFEGLQAFVVPFLIAFLPLTIWIWDIPFTDRIVCMHLHDRRMLLAEGLPLKGRHLYYFGAALYTLLTAARLYSSPFLKGGGEWTVARKKFGTPQPQEIAA